MQVTAKDGAGPESAASADKPFDRLQALMKDDLDRVDAMIRARMVSEAAPLIAELAAHLISAGGKRLRPILTLAAARLCAGGRALGDAAENPIRLATAVEFIHTATLLHDDVVDGSDKRRGKAAANILFGNKPSILVGDFLFSRSFQLMVETGSLQVLDVLSGAAAVIAEGEVLQLATVNQLPEDETVYMTVIRAKTAALFEAATRSGAIAAGADAAQEDAMRRYGDHLGVAFQLADDALDYGGKTAALGKSVGDDFREGKATLPALLAYRRADADGQAFWKRVIEKRQQTDEDLDRAVAMLLDSGAMDDTLARAREHGAAAKAALSPFPPSELTEALTDIVDFVVDRAT